MNCRPGDLAIVVKSDFPRCIGNIVQVLRPYDGIRFSRAGAAWWVEDRDGVLHCADEALRPIRPNDGEDETLTWAGKPQKETA